MHGLAGDIGPFGITINAVAPGLTRTQKAIADVLDAYFHLEICDAVQSGDLLRR